MDKIRIACCGGWHTHAIEFAMDRPGRFCADLAHEFVAIWDDDPIRGQKWAADMGIGFEPDYDKLCADKNIDAFMITCCTTKHAELIIKAANAGKHIFVEKALTTVPEEAYAIRDAVKAAGVHFTMSDPIKLPHMKCIKDLIDTGVIGDITCMRYRIPHGLALVNMNEMAPCYKPEEAGGGVMADMGHHAVHAFYWLLGKPISACGVFGRYMPEGKASGIDDNSAILFEYPNGVIAIAESGYVCPGGQTTFVAYGTKGFIIYDVDGVRYRFSEDGEWIWISEVKYPENECYPLRFWMKSILDDTPDAQCGIDEAVIITEIIAAAYGTDGKSASIEYK